MQSREVDICIVTFNRKESLVNIIKALEKQTNQNFNLIINDDGSKELIDPNLFPIISKYSWNKDIGFFKNQRINESVLACPSPYIICLDDDCIIQNDNFIQAHIDCLKTYEFSRGKVQFVDGSVANWFSGANMAFRRSVLEDYGLYFPEYNGSYGYDDIDLGHDLERRNISIHHNEDACVLMGMHKYLDGDRSDSVVGRNKAIFQKRWGYVP
jgi:glycosyltransferase involved in cell wall biosynthesis